MEYKNGSLWTNDKDAVILQQLTGELFCLLSVNAASGFTLVMDPVHAGKWQYSAEEIPERLEGWKQATGHVSIEQPSQTPSQPTKEVKKKASKNAKKET